MGRYHRRGCFGPAFGRLSPFSSAAPIHLFRFLRQLPGILVESGPDRECGNHLPVLDDRGRGHNRPEDRTARKLHVDPLALIHDLPAERTDEGQVAQRDGSAVGAECIELLQNRVTPAPMKGRA